MNNLACSWFPDRNLGASLSSRTYSWIQAYFILTLRSRYNSYSTQYVQVQFILYAACTSTIHTLRSMYTYNLYSTQQVQVQFILYAACTRSIHTLRSRCKYNSYASSTVHMTTHLVQFIITLLLFYYYYF